MKQYLGALARAFALPTVVVGLLFLLGWLASATAKVTVVRAVGDIAMFVELEDDDLAVTNVPEQDAPGGALSSIDAAAGRITTKRLEAGDVVSRTVAVKPSAPIVIRTPCVLSLSTDIPVPDATASGSVVDAEFVSRSGRSPSPHTFRDVLVLEVDRDEGETSLTLLMHCRDVPAFADRAGGADLLVVLRRS